MGGGGELLFDGFDESRIAEGVAGAGGFENTGLHFGFGEAVLESGVPEARGPVGGPGREIEPIVGWMWGRGEMSLGAAPMPGVATGDEAGANGIAFDISENGGEVARFDGAGVETMAPEMAGFTAADVEPAGVVVVSEADGAGESLGRGGGGDDVDVVGHEAIAEDIDLVSGGVLLKEFEVDFAVSVGEEDVLAVVAALGDVVRAVGDDDAAASGHM